MDPMPGWDYRPAASSLFLMTAAPAAAGAVSNIGAGANTFLNLTTGTGNIGLGTGAFGALRTGNSNIAIGDRAMSATETGIDNVAIGVDSMRSALYTVGNTAVGRLTLERMTNGGNNTAIGDSASRYLTTGTGNVTMGYRTHEANVDGINNTIIGVAAGIHALSGDNNTALGYFALNAFTDGGWNTAVGAGALQGATATSDPNAAFGARAGYYLTTGVRNTFLGSHAGNHASQKVDVVDSIAVGHHAFTTKDGQVSIGSDVTAETLVRALTLDLGKTPTSPVGLEPGRVWRDGTALHVAAA